MHRPWPVILGNRNNCGESLSKFTSILCYLESFRQQTFIFRPKPTDPQLSSVFIKAMSYENNCDQTKKSR